MRAGLADAAHQGWALCSARTELEALPIAMDLDELLHEAGTLHGAVCLFGRIDRDPDD